jgi:hypothetical protein
MGSSSPCLVDAMVVIDGFRYGFWEPLIGGHTVAVVEEVREEAQYYKGAGGEKVPIDLQPHLDARRVRMELPTLHEVRALRQLSKSRRLDKGEFASLALALARHHHFCTADRRAVRAMKDLGILDRWVPLEDLLSALDPPLPIPEAKYSRAAAEPK